MRVETLDHIVLAVADVERSLAWYCGELGLEPVRAEEWRAGDAPFPSARISADTIIDLIERGEDGGGGNFDHFCLVVSPEDLAQVRASGRFEIIRDPDFALYGARGLADGLYIRDPDGNEIELRAYGAPSV